MSNNSMLQDDCKAGDTAAILTVGAPTIDWLNFMNFDLDNYTSLYWPLRRQAGIHLTAKPGGVFALYSLLSEMMPTNCSLVQPAFQEAQYKWIRRKIGKGILPFNNKCRNNWTLWKAYSDGGVQDDSQRHRMVGRTDRERGCFTVDVSDEDIKKIQDKNYLLVVIDDPGGESSASERGSQENIEVGWIARIANQRKGQKQSYFIRIESDDMTSENDFPESPIFREFRDNKNLASNTTLLTTVRDLRGANVRIGTSLSWERVFDDVVKAINKLFERDFARIMVTIGLSGVVIVENDGDRQRKALIFAHSNQEGDFERKHKGRVLGYSTCMLTSLAASWAEDPVNVDWEKAARNGLSLMRELHEVGYKKSDFPASRPVLEFPRNRIKEKYFELPEAVKSTHSTFNYKEDVVKDIGIFIEKRSVKNDTDKNEWSILENELDRSKDKDDSQVPLFRVEEYFYPIAERLAREGAGRALKNVPVEQVGKWISADRKEIEGVRSVHNAIRNYLTEQSGTNKPLSIAVFGPPGSGKSFVVKQIAESLGLEKNAQLTFNLSQYETSTELAKAFQKVRDVQLKGHCPLVFWDEFDSKCGNDALGWLRYFLAPMQDSEFIDNGIIHPLGKAIYVFAGGTEYSYADFSASKDEKEKAKDKEVKKPDFMSRLKAYIDVKGPDKARIVDKKIGSEDRMYMIRRAFLLRASLELVAPFLQESYTKKISYDEGVLSAFLRVTEYNHGARSLQAIVEQSDFVGKTKYEVSSLPPEHILRMHVDVGDFMEKLNGTTR